ncbi:MAG: DUF4124 domain-containing protein [Zoogloea sp.]|nr:DUF4124 domain-containing protein [Zoogloea sp.]MBK7846607.1 DUF4124 domain-containing protein [Zoogloea sp.]MBP7444025.1 DUF4124 domain-containing protein [Zoogloea sp.]TXG94772.1 MAG: DUF4124 domain-containing protein [Zoogloea sp.]
MDMVVNGVARSGLRASVVAALAVAMAVFAPSAVAVNKCVGVDGKVTYTDGPCGGGSQVSRVETPPPLSREEQAAAMSRSEGLVREARELEARRAREAAERRRYEDMQRQIEAQRRQAELDEAERLSRMSAQPVYSVPVYPVPLRYRPHSVLPPATQAAPVAPPAKMRAYPFR